MKKQDKEWYKIYYAKNRERKMAQQKVWREKNSELLLIKRKKYYLENKEKFALINKKYREENIEKISARKKKYHQKNREKINIKMKKWYSENQNKVLAWRERNKEQRKEYGKQYQKENRKKLQEYKNHRAHSNPTFKLQKVLRARMLSALKKGSKSGSAIKDLGCTITELKLHLEKQFTEGMTWENHGLYGWHIDHKKPLASFDLTDKKQFIKAVHYKNLTPLWARENWSKGDRQ